MVQLKSMGIGEILDTSFRLYKNNFLVFIQIMLPIYLISFVIGVVYQFFVQLIRGEGQASMVAAVIILLSSFIFGLFITFLKFIAEGALVQAVSSHYLGSSISFEQAYGKVRAQLATLMGVGIVSSIMINIGTIMLLIPGIVLGVFLSVAIPVAVLEQRGVWATIGRSFELVASYFGKVFLVCLVAYLVMLFASLTANLPLFIWGFMRGLSKRAGEQLPFLINVLQIALNNIMALFTSPFWMISLTLLYYDIRIRKEGFDIDVMAQSLGYKKS